MRRYIPIILSLTTLFVTGCRHHRKPHTPGRTAMQAVIYAAAQIMLREHNALGHSRCAGGVYQHRQLLGVAGKLLKTGKPQLSQLISAGKQTVHRQKALPFLLGTVNADEVADVCKLGKLIPQKRCMLFGVKQDACVAVLQNVQNVFLQTALTQ